MSVHDAEVEGRQAEEVAVARRQRRAEQLFEFVLVDVADLDAVVVVFGVAAVARSRRQQVAEQAAQVAAPTHHHRGPVAAHELDVKLGVNLQFRFQT